jgi:exo-beta-1,3-glucanase (GH17 family)
MTRHKAGSLVLLRLLGSSCAAASDRASGNAEDAAEDILDSGKHAFDYASDQHDYACDNASRGVRDLLDIFRDNDFDFVFVHSFISSQL